MSTPMLSISGLVMRFGGINALSQVSFDVQEGHITSVIGPNGAGKTTMMDVITGKTRPDSGTAFFGQTIDLKEHSEVEIAQAGIGRKFQKPTIFEHHTVFENLELAMKADKRVRKTLNARQRRADLDKIAETLALTGAEIKSVALAAAGIVVGTQLKIGDVTLDEVVA